MRIEAVKMGDVAAYQGSTGVQSSEEENTVEKPELQQNSKMTVETKNGSDEHKESGITGNSEQLKKAVSDLNKKMSNAEAIFGIHEETNRVMIKIVDKDSRKVIKEYPAEETLDMIAKVWEVAGIMVDEKR